MFSREYQSTSVNCTTHKRSHQPILHTAVYRPRVKCDKATTKLHRLTLQEVRRACGRCMTQLREPFLLESWAKGGELRGNTQPICNTPNTIYVCTSTRDRKAVKRLILLFSSSPTMALLGLEVRHNRGNIPHNKKGTLSLGLPLSRREGHLMRA